MSRVINLRQAPREKEKPAISSVPVIQHEQTRPVPSRASTSVQRRPSPTQASSWSVVVPRRGALHQYRFVVILVLVGAAALFGIVQGNFLIALILGLMALVFALRFHARPQEMRVLLGEHGVQINDEVYYYKNLVSFWIDYEPGGAKELSLEVKKWYLPYLKIPLMDQNPVSVRTLLAGFLPEREHESSAADVFLRRLGH